MAQSPPDEVATSSQAATHPPQGNFDAASTPQTESITPSSRQSQEPSFLSFQAVNSKLSHVSGNDTDSAMSGRDQDDDQPTPPPQVTNAPLEKAQSARASPAGPQTHGKSSNVTGGDSGAAEPSYGTRSRGNRTSTRVNYAEDQQDLDFESAATTTSYKKKQLTDTAVATQPTGGDSKRGFTAVNTNSTNAQPITKEGVAATTSSKKRKSAGGPASLSHPANQPAASSASPVPSGATRKTGAIVLSNAQPRETNLMTFKNHRNRLNKNGELVADDGTKLRINDHVYLVSEPPGDPYYLCRIMEFLHVDSSPTAPVDSLRVNWYYRPRDVQRFNSDSRLVYATMHSDMCPITSVRGRCTIKHRSEIDDLDTYRKERDSFYFVQVFDRFIRRWYECIPTSQIINVPEKVKKALDERWKFVAVEIGRVKELTSAVKTCKRCARYCASHDSVDCAICKNSYHMNCVQPPLPKKPSRGFAWACGPCGRASERKMEARNTPNLSAGNTDVEDDEFVEEEAQEVSNDTTRAPSPSTSDIVVDDHPATLAEIRLAQMWPMRYLGIHCRVEDALQYDDRAIYPRASSRLGPRHQANTQVWHGRPVELVTPIEIKKKFVNSKSHKKEGKLSKETVAAIEADRIEKAKRPKWIQDAPPGYVERGEDYPNNDPRNTAKRIFIMPDQTNPAVQESGRSAEAFVLAYVKDATHLARNVGVPPFGINFIDKVLELFTDSDCDAAAAIKKVQKIDRRKDLHEPVLSKDQLQKFEEGVAKYGSEHRLIRLHMKTTIPHSDIVRFYYLWKKTPRGREIWGNYGGRKGTKRKLESDAGARLQAEISHEADDSAFDNDKAMSQKRSFQCKFCNTRHSRQWRKAPGVSPGQTILAESKGNKDKKERMLLALCLRCAGLWRKYAIQWEDIDEVAKKVAQTGGRSSKRKIDEELLRELIIANDVTNTSSPEPLVTASIEGPNEPPKKKSKSDAQSAQAEPAKKKEKPPPPPPKLPTPPPPPIIPNQPIFRVLPCAVCSTEGNTIECEHCRLTVHRRCFGLDDKEGVKANGETHWVCEQCQNDRNPQVSTDYACALCLTEETAVDMVETPRVSHKKKNDREKEKDRLEKELCEALRAEYRGKQLSLNRPLLPREPLKRTAGNNWVHVYCAVWTPEVRFSNAKKLEVAEGIQLIPQARHEAVCKLCRNRDHNNRQRFDKGACVTCFQCGAYFHVSCAFEAGCRFGFDVTPVKGSRKDSITTITLGEETGSVTAAIWCKEHILKSVVHSMAEVMDESGRTALQHYVENYKQADLTWTGTARKANLAQSTKEKAMQNILTAPSNNNRRESTNNGVVAAARRGARGSLSTDARIDDLDGTAELADGDLQSTRLCMKCGIDVTPKWHAIDRQFTESAAPPNKDRTRIDMTLREITDRAHEQSSEVPKLNGSAEVAGANVMDVRFMSPGAGARALSSHAIADTLQSRIAGDSSLPRGPNEVNGDTKISIEQSVKAENDEVYGNHALNRHPNPAASPSVTNKVTNDATQQYLCHKCFVKRKLDPTPPPPDPPVRRELSPPKQMPLQLGWPQNVPPPPQHGTYDTHARPHHWEESIRHGQQPQPPPPTNGFVPPPPPPPPPAYQHQVHGSYGANYRPPPPYPSNGFSGHATSQPPPPPPPPHHGPIWPMHERHSSFTHPHQTQPSPNAPPSVPHHGPPPPNMASHNGYRPASLPGPPTSQPMPNGVPSPHPAPQYHQQIQSPNAPPPHPQYPPFQGPQRRNGSPFSTQLPPISQPLHSGGTGAQSEHSTPQSQQPGAQHSTPQLSSVRPEPQIGRSGTPLDSHHTGTPVQSAQNTSGASASPNLRNLLH